MHPILKLGVSIGALQEGADITHYYIKNAAGEEFEISYRLYKALFQADGTRPLNLPEGGRRILPKLKKYGLVQTSRFARNKGVLNNFILFIGFKKLQNKKRIFRVINAVLPMLSVFIFVIGIYMMNLNGKNIRGEYWNGWLYYGFITFSIFLHELGHLIAGVAYGYKMSDMGILLFGIIPVGAYVAHEDKKNATKGEKIQFSLAGVEMNFLIAGACFLLVGKYYQQSLTLLTAAVVNIVLALINLLPTSGLDGEAALSAICGIKNISKTVRKWLANKKCRQKLFRQGLPGYICFGVFSIVLISKVVFWLITAWSIVSIIF